MTKEIGITVTTLLLGSITLAQSPTTGAVDVGGYKLHVLLTGQGTPPVVFENGMGEDVSTWTKVQPQLSKVTQTLSYDRGGLGQSDPVPSSSSRDALALATELHKLLQAAKVHRPCVLVGHSLGGAIVQVYAHEYPDDVAALVLVDPGDGRLNELLRTRLPAEVWAAREKALAEEMPKMPAAVRQEYEGLKLSGEEASRAYPLPSVPTILLTGTKKNPDFPGNPIEQDLKLELHKEISAHTSGVEHILVPESRHYIQDDAPQKVISAVERVLNKVRAGDRKSAPQ